MSSLTKVDYNVLALIFSFLSYKQILLSVNRVDKQLNKVTKNRICWKSTELEFIYPDYDNDYYPDLSINDEELPPFYTTLPLINRLSIHTSYYHSFSNLFILSTLNNLKFKSMIEKLSILEINLHLFMKIQNENFQNLTSLKFNSIRLNEVVPDKYSCFNELHFSPLITSSLTSITFTDSITLEMLSGITSLINLNYIKLWGLTDHYLDFDAFPHLYDNWVSNQLVLPDLSPLKELKTFKLGRNHPHSRSLSFNREKNKKVSEALIKTLNQCTNLQSLSLFKIESTGGDIFQNLASQLIVFKTDIPLHFDAFSKLEHLICKLNYSLLPLNIKHLEITTTITSSDFEMINHTAKQLEHLKVTLKPNQTSHHLINFNRLTSLDLSIKPVQNYSDLLKDIIINSSSLRIFNLDIISQVENDEPDDYEDEKYFLSIDLSVPVKIFQHLPSSLKVFSYNGYLNNETATIIFTRLIYLTELTLNNNIKNGSISDNFTTNHLSIETLSLISNLKYLERLELGELNLFSMEILLIISNLKYFKILKFNFSNLDYEKELGEKIRNVDLTVLKSLPHLKCIDINVSFFLFTNNDYVNNLVFISRLHDENDEMENILHKQCIILHEEYNIVLNEFEMKIKYTCYSD
jgi:hypothetical protein